MKNTGRCRALILAAAVGSAGAADNTVDPRVHLLVVPVTPEGEAALRGPTRG